MMFPVEPKLGPAKGRSVKACFHRFDKHGNLLVLIVQRAKHNRVNNNKGRWTLPGGKHDQVGQLMRNALHREVGEEIGPHALSYLKSAVYLGDYTYRRDFDSNQPLLDHHGYAVPVKGGLPIALDKEELRNFRWVKVSPFGGFGRFKCVPGVRAFIKKAAAYVFSLDKK
jgi:8-oxo-dGTP pyrophosphatase MutT (NUDIX family)